MEIRYTKTSVEYHLENCYEYGRYLIQKQTKEEIKEERIKLAEIKKRVVKHLARKGKLNEALDAGEVFIAIMDGVLPERYDIHHFVPISWGGRTDWCWNNESDWDNICVIDKRLHAMLTKVMNKIHKRIAQSKDDVRHIVCLPPFQSVLKWEDANLFFTREEIRNYLKEEELKLKRRIVRTEKEFRLKTEAEIENENRPAKKDLRKLRAKVAEIETAIENFDNEEANLYEGKKIPFIERLKNVGQTSVRVYDLIRFAERAKRFKKSGRVVLENAKDSGETERVEERLKNVGAYYAKKLRRRIREYNTQYNRERERIVQEINYKRQMENNGSTRARGKKRMSAVKIAKNYIPRFYPHIAALQNED